GGVVSAVGEETLVTLLEALRVNMRTPPLGSIALDPLVLDDQVIQHRHPALSATINLDAMTITGLSEYAIDQVTLNVGELTAFLQLSYGELRLGGQHVLKARIARVIPLTRRGGFTVTTENPQVRIRVGLRVVRGRLEVRNVSTRLEISGVKTKLTNLPASGLLARILDEVLEDLLKQELPRLEVEINAALKSLLNTEFSNYNVGMSLQILRTSDKLMRRGSI
ncbi:hemolymph juvenile hormone binding, partial [Trinorchestia longiramus]